MKSVFFTFIMVCLMTINSFSQTSSLSFQFKHTAEGQPLELNKTIFTIHNGKKIKLTRAEFYLSNILLFSSDNDSVKVEDSYLLVNAKNPDIKHSVGTFPSNYNFKKIKMFVGIDKEKNHGDPNLYLATHPLGPKTPDMHWGWTAGYRFMAIEGYVDNNNDGIPEQNFQIHSLGDELLFTTFLDVSASQKITTDPFVINLDYVKLFNAISMSGNIIQHGSGTLNKNMLLNAANAGFISPQIILSSQDEVKLESIASFTQNNRSLNINFNDVLSSKNVIIYSQSGQMVFSERIENAVFNHELSEVSSGNYVITVIDGEKMARKQIFIR